MLKEKVADSFFLLKYVYFVYFSFSHRTRHMCQSLLTLHIFIALKHGTILSPCQLKFDRLVTISEYVVAFGLSGSSSVFCWFSHAEGYCQMKMKPGNPKQNTDSAYDSAAFDLEKTFRLLHFEHKEVLRTSIILGLRHYREKGHVLSFFFVTQISSKL